MRNFKKKGLTQIDWAISLAIFLLYIAWFFIFARPQVTNDSLLKPLSSDFLSRFDEEVMWGVSKTPIFISSSQNYSGPVFVNASIVGNNFYIDGTTNYLLDEDKLVITDFFSSQKNVYYLIKSDEIYNNTPGQVDLEITQNMTSNSKNLSISINQGLLETISHFEQVKLNSFSIRLNDQDITRENNTFEDKKLLASYNIYSQPINVYTKTYALSTLTRILIERNDDFNRYNLTISYELPLFEGFYSNGENKMSYSNDSECQNFISNYLRFYENNLSLVIETSEDLNMSICADNQESRITMNTQLEQTLSISFEIVPDKEGVKTSFNLSNGLSENLTGYDEGLLVNLEYDALKTKLRFSQEHGFSIKAYDSSKSNLAKRTKTNTLLDIGGVKQNNYEIYSKETEKIMIDKYGNQRPITLVVGVW